MRDRTKKGTALLVIMMALAVPFFLITPADAVDPTRFEGIVTDYITDEPIEGANVMLLDGRIGEEVTTDENGYYSFDIDKGGEYSLIASMEDYYDEFKEEYIVIGETKEIDFILIPYKTFVTGRVTDDTTGEGIADAYVEFHSPEITAHGFTDEDGHYDIGIEGGTYELYIKANDYDSFREEDVKIKDGQENKKDIELEKFEQGMHGYVMLEDGTPVEGAQLVINGAAGGTTRYCWTNEDGYYETYLQIGRYKINVNKPGNPSTSGRVEIEYQEMLEKDWTMYESSPKNFIMRFIMAILDLIGTDM